MTRVKFNLVLAMILCWGVSFQYNASFAQRQSHSLLNKQLPPIGGAPPPDNRTQPGGGLDPSDSACTSASGAKLTVLIPRKNPVMTTSDRPTVLLYVPYSSDRVREGELLVNSRDDKTRLGKIRFTLPQTPGIVSVTLPTPENSLEEGEYYHWYLKLYCTDDPDVEPEAVDGWVQRVATPPQEESQRIWYDDLAAAYENLRNSPQEEMLQREWVNLLQEINAADLAEIPLVGPVVPTE